MNLDEAVNDFFDDNVLEFADGFVRKNGNQYCIYSKTGKKLECYNSKKKAEDRLAQIETIKHIKEQEESNKKKKNSC